MRNDRKGYYLKPGVRVTAPGSLFIVCVDAMPVRDQPSEQFNRTEFFRAVAAHVTYRRGKWSSPIEAEFREPVDLHKWIEGMGSRWRRNYIVCPIASDVLTVTRWWALAEEWGITWAARRQAHEPPPPRPGQRGPVVFRRLVLRGKPDIVHYSHRGKTFIWLSGIQYLADGPPTAAGTTSPPVNNPHQHVSAETIPTDPTRQKCRDWLAAVRALADWWRREAFAPWGMTAGQLAVGILRSNIQRGDLCSHRCVETHKLERLAQHGGRATMFFHGSVGEVPAWVPAICATPGKRPLKPIPGPAVCLDYRSMYPSLLRDEWFPVKLKGHSVNPDPREPTALARDMGIIARVRIETCHPEFPRRYRDFITYPLGEFTTTLTGPELLELRKWGRVLQCHAMAVYALGQPFRPAAGKLLSLRAAARAAGNASDELFAKLLGNSLGGKLAQKRGSWVERRNVPAETRWGQFYDLDAKTGKRRKFRSVGGLVWEWVPDHTSAGPFGAAFAYLTAYGRLRMAKLRRDCPDHSVYAQDTDGVWVHPDAVKSLQRKRWRFGDNPGELRVDHQAAWVRWWGPRHYVTDRGWTLSGFHNPDPIRDKLTITATHKVNPLNWSPDAPPVQLFEETRTCELKPEIHGGTLDPFGWFQPHTVTPRHTPG